MKTILVLGLAAAAILSLGGCGVFLPHDGAVVAVPKGTTVDATVAEDVTPALLKAHRPDMGQAPYQITRVLTVEKNWRPERNAYGVIVGRTIRMDAIARSGDKCWVLHFVVLEDHGNYEANRTYATIDGDQADRHRVDCTKIEPTVDQGRNVGAAHTNR